MTKARAPLSVDAALARIAGQIPGSWAQMAELCGRQERTVRNWGDPDTPEQIPVDCAIALDIAFQRHGGEGAPIFETYSLQLELARIEQFASEFELSRRTEAAAKEVGEAISALIGASRPGANPTDHANTVREVTEAIDSLKATLPMLTQGKVPAGSPGTSRPEGGHADG